MTSAKRAMDDKKARRERIATAVMPALVQTMSSAPDEVIARQAVGLADALIVKLDEKDHVPLDKRCNGDACAVENSFHWTEEFDYADERNVVHHEPCRLATGGKS